MTQPDAPPDDNVTLDAITADFRIVQRRRGHRFSLDDLAVAYEAARARPAARTYVDLGCGSGSVLLMVSWKLPDVQVVGVEALDVSMDLARRNVALNGLEGRVTVVHGDLREVTRAWPHEAAELVTGTPPYFPVGSALPSADAQRTAARLELRGGVEAYLSAAARVLAPGGRAVVCGDGRRPDRVLTGAAAAGLAPLRRVEVFGRAGVAHPLLSVWTLGWASEGTPALEVEPLVVRDAAGVQTDAARRMRQFFGLVDRPRPAVVS